MTNHADTDETGADGDAAAYRAAQRAADAASLSGASQELQDFIADLEDLVQATTSLTGEDLARAKAQLFERIAAARRAAGHVRSGLLARTRTRIKVVTRYVHERPWTSLGLGVGAGIVFGLLLSRRR